MIARFAAVSLASLFQNAGLSMDLFTPNESGRDNFLMDLFIVLVIAFFRRCESCAIGAVSPMIPKRKIFVTGTKYVAKWIDQSTSRSVDTHHSSAQTVARVSAIYVPEGFVDGCSSRANDRAPALSVATSYTESFGVRGRRQRQRWLATR